MTIIKRKNWTYSIACYFVVTEVGFIVLKIFFNTTCKNTLTEEAPTDNNAAKMYPKDWKKLFNYTDIRSLMETNTETGIWRKISAWGIKRSSCIIMCRVIDHVRKSELFYRSLILVKWTDAEITSDMATLVLKIIAQIKNEVQNFTLKSSDKGMNLTGLR